MSYATVEDLALRLGPSKYLELTDDEAAGHPNVAQAEEALAAAHAEIDSRLVSRYAAPVDLAGEPETAGLLKSFVLDLAEHRLYARRPPVPEAIRQKATDAREWLHDMLVGRAHLPLVRAAQEPVAHGPLARTSGPARVFRRPQMSQDLTE
jgi:phage gp36-like protein